MQPFSLKYFGNLKKQKTDILILLPHPGTGEGWGEMISGSWLGESHLSSHLFSGYLAHEADRGSREIISESIEILCKNNLFGDHKIALFDIDIPRGICDLNRTWERACPQAIDNTLWKPLYDETLSALFRLLDHTDYCLQFHTMNGRNPLYRFELSRESTESDIEKFLETCYSGEKRTCNILTELTTGEYISSRKHDDILITLFRSRDISLHENTAYRFAEYFPATDITRRASSSLIEITKDSLANDDTMDFMNSSKIIFDPDKVSRFAYLFSEFFVGLLQKSS